MEKDRMGKTAGVVGVGSVLAVWWLPWRDFLALDSAALLSLNSQVLMPWLVLLAVLASLVWGMLAALEWDD